MLRILGIDEQSQEGNSIVKAYARGHWKLIKANLLLICVMCDLFHSAFALTQVQSMKLRKLTPCFYQLAQGKGTSSQHRLCVNHLASSTYSSHPAPFVSSFDNINNNIQHECKGKESIVGN